MPQFSIYQIMPAPTRVARSDDDAGPLVEDDHMITKRRFVSLARAGGFAAIFPNAICNAVAETVSRMLVGFGAGGAIDVIARMLVEGMKDHSPSFIVDNRPGAGGRLALGALKSSPADGTAMILTPASSVAIFPHVYKSLGYDPFKDFAPVTTVCSFPFLITVGPMVPAEVRTLADFVTWCAAHPRQATYGTAAAGSMLHHRREPGQGRPVRIRPPALWRPGRHSGPDRRSNCRDDLSNRHGVATRAIRRYPGTGDNRTATIATNSRCADGS
jgi:hypothetical protein